ncbi:MAG TPA: hypothetical protein VKU19_32595 [Bryobacteraceae bacterium]|nr:hypothetical protein [Bryobacteraceae bacterium]
MQTTTRFQKFLVLAAVALTATFAVADDGGKNGVNNNNNGEVRLRAKLSGPAIQNKTPEGSADFRMDDKGRARLNVEVENVNLPAANVLTVAIVHAGASTTAGTITLSATGFGELELESQNGAIVPAVQAGDMVTFSNGATVVLTGIFASMS